MIPPGMKRLPLFKPGVLSLLVAVALAGCAGPTAPPPDPSARAESPPASAAVAKAASSSPIPSAPAAPPIVNLPDAGDPDAAPAPAETAKTEAPPPTEAAPAPIDPENKTKPPETSEELQARAKALFEAIVKDEPPLGDPFWFPLEPFIPLKDVKGPEKYWKNLHAAYAADIHKVHKKRKSWEGARFKDFKIGSIPKWVKPGDEANKIGYYRSFRGKLRYELDGETYSIEVHTVISWQGRWYITHLLKFKK
jgi:hypothetical protein